MKSNTRRNGARGPRNTRRGGGGTAPDMKETHTWTEFTAIVDELTKYGYDEFLEQHKKLYDEKAALDVLKNKKKATKQDLKRLQILNDVINFNLMLMTNACNFVCPPKESPVVVHKLWRQRGNERV